MNCRSHLFKVLSAFIASFEVKWEVMRIGLMLIAVASSVALAAKPTVVLSGPAPVTKWVSQELSKKYTPKILKGSISALPTAKEVRNATAPSGAIALIICQATGQFVTLQVLNGADGTPLDTVSIKASVKKLPRAMAKPQLAALMFAVGSGKAPGKEAAPVAEKPESNKEVATVKKRADEEPRAKRAQPEEPIGEPIEEVVEKAPTELKPSVHPALRASVGVGGFNRSFTWAGNPSPSLATANQPFSGDIAVDASWYPGAHFTSNFLSNLGVFVNADFGVGMVSRVGESRFAHASSRVRFGALVRLPLGDRFSLAAHLGYSRHELTTSAIAVNDGSARPNIPDVLFNGFRTGLGLRLRIAGTFEIDALGGFQVVVGKGELGSARFFPGATALAIDAGGGLSIGLAEHLRLRAGVEWQRYFITLNAAEASTFFAQQASDQYITAAASLQWSM